MFIGWARHAKVMLGASGSDEQASGADMDSKRGLTIAEDVTLNFNFRPPGSTLDQPRGLRSQGPSWRSTKPGIATSTGQSRRAVHEL
jgi:hypothetical protein